MMRKQRLLAGILITVLGNSAWACRCLEASAESAADRAVLIVAGRVVEHAPLHDGDGSVAIVAVEKHWKGEAAERIAVVSRTSCRVSWGDGERHLLYLFRDEDGLYSTSRCDGNLPLSSAGERIRMLDKRFSPGN